MQKNHLEEQIICNKNEGVQTRRRLARNNEQVNFCLMSEMEPKIYGEAKKSEKWMKAMEEELLQTKKKKTLDLVPWLADKNNIARKWVYRNKMNKEGKVIRKKARLVCKGYAQVEGIYFEETFALVVRLEAIRMLLAFSAHKQYVIWRKVMRGDQVESFTLLKKGVKVSQRIPFNFPHTLHLKEGG